MTNAIAIALGLLVVLSVGVDYVFFDAEHLLFLGKKFFALLNWMAFWH